MITCKITGFEETRQIHVVRDQSNQPTDLQPDEPKTVLHLRLPKGQTIKAAVPYDDFVSQVLPQLEGSAATDIREFRLDDRSQETFDRWKAETETKRNGTVTIVFQEIIHEGIGLLISYRIEPHKHMARPRR